MGWFVLLPATVDHRRNERRQHPRCQRAGARLFLLRGRTRSPVSGATADTRRGVAHGGELRQSRSSRNECKSPISRTTVEIELAVRRKETGMTQAEIEAKLENLSNQLSRLVERQQSRNKKRFWIGGLSLLLALGYLFSGAIMSTSALSLAGIPLLFVSLGFVCVRNGGAITGLPTEQA
jgi:hypothetical protein